MHKGFTIVELLIVIVVIGILAAIGIISYNGYQKRAYDASVQSDLESISGELEAYRARVSTNNVTQHFPDDSTDLSTLEIQAAKSTYSTTIPYNLIYCVGPSTGSDPYQSFKLIAQSKTGSIFVMTQDGFVANSLTTANLTSSLCTSQGMSLQINGMTTGGVWASWVASS